MTFIGFTGTKQGMTAEQRLMLRRQLKLLIKGEYQEFHHGDCIGADAQAHRIARQLNFAVVIHPPSDPKLRAFCQVGERGTLLDPKPYLVRNQDIVDAVDLLLATPKEYSEVIRSGTWSTIRKAQKRKIEVVIIDPQGRIIS